MPTGVYERKSKTPAQIAADEAKRGVPNSPEHNAAIKKGLKNSDAVKAYADSRRGIPLSPETCAKISKTLTGVPRTTPAQIAADEAKRDIPNSPEHNAAISAATTGRTLSPEHNAAISKAQKGVPKSPETCAAISKALQESDAHKSAADTMRGGYDICEHHYIYDHSDLSLNTVQMTRSDHTSLHNVLRSLGYIVPHINQ